MRNFLNLLKTAEWPTLLALALCYASFVLSLYVLPLPLAIIALAVVIAFQSSLQHEVIHGHPFATQWLNEALVYVSLNLLIPFGRFRDTHLAHHKNERLTDPYDDPESNYLSAQGWGRLCVLRQTAMRFNNTLFGRLLIGPIVSQVYFMLGDYHLIRRGTIYVLRVWALHCICVGVLLSIISLTPMPIWAYLLSAYLGLSLVKIRTFAEHQAHEKIGHRTVIIEDRGLLALLFLNNNLHAVHHIRPKVAWYKLPALYRAQRVRFLQHNGGYHFPKYMHLFRGYFFSAKDPLIHPRWQNDRK